MASAPHYYDPYHSFRPPRTPAQKLAIGRTRLPARLREKARQWHGPPTTSQERLWACPDGLGIWEDLFFRPIARQAYDMGLDPRRTQVLVLPAEPEADQGFPQEPQDFATLRGLRAERMLLPEFAERCRDSLPRKEDVRVLGFFPGKGRNLPAFGARYLGPYDGLQWAEDAPRWRKQEWEPLLLGNQARPPLGRPFGRLPGSPPITYARVSWPEFAAQKIFSYPEMIRAQPGFLSEIQWLRAWGMCNLTPELGPEGQLTDLQEARFLDPFGNPLTDALRLPCLPPEKRAWRGRDRYLTGSQILVGFLTGEIPASARPLSRQEDEGLRYNGIRVYA